MIISGTVRLDPAAHAAATAALDDRLADLDLRRRAAESVVDELLASWHGDAASAFRREWDVWSRAAAEVMAELGATVDALASTRADLIGVDDRAGVAAESLRGRLDGRPR